MFSRTLVQIVTGATGLAEHCAERVLGLADQALPGWMAGMLRTASNNGLALSKRAVWQIIGWLPRSTKDQIGMSLLVSGVSKQIGQKGQLSQLAEGMDPGALLGALGSNPQAMQLQMLARKFQDESKGKAEGSE